MVNKVTFCRQNYKNLYIFSYLSQINISSKYLKTYTMPMAQKYNKSIFLFRIKNDFIILLLYNKFKIQNHYNYQHFKKRLCYN